jgi:hypothetical protein
MPGRIGGAQTPVTLCVPVTHLAQIIDFRNYIYPSPGSAPMCGCAADPPGGAVGQPARHAFTVTAA